jgi:glycerol-3-phosphate dehydrogenase subunit B
VIRPLDELPAFRTTASAQRTFDVVVLGGGLAGAVAAKKAAEAGRRVGLVREGGGATVHSSGAFDVVSPRGPLAAEGGTPPLLRPALEALLRANPHHPYAIVGAGDAGAVIGLLEEATDDLFRDLDEEGLLYRGGVARNLWVATPGGHVKESAFAQEAIAAGDLAALPKARIAAVAVALGGPSDGALAAAKAEARARAAGIRRALDARGFFGVRELIPVAVAALPRGAGRAADEVTVARALDDQGVAAAWAKEVARALDAEAPRATHLLFPPLLGLAEPGAAVAVVKAETGREVLETVALPPSVPGLRLGRALDRVLERKGVTVMAGRAVRAEAVGPALRRVSVAGRDGAVEPVEARAFILAAGRYLGGGLRERNRVGEPLFDLPLYYRGRPIEEIRPGEWLDRHVVSPHPVLAFGVRCATDLRPIGRSGGPAFDNLFAAGGVMAGGSFATDGTGLGVGLATGYVAGLNAAEAV